MAGTVAVIRRQHGLVMNSLGIEKPDEWSGDGKDVALLGYGREDLVRLLDATGVE